LGILRKESVERAMVYRLGDRCLDGQGNDLATIGDLLLLTDYYLSAWVLSTQVTSNNLTLRVLRDAAYQRRSVSAIL